MSRGLVAAVSLLVGGASLASTAEVPDELARRFSYDSSQPLNETWTLESQRDGASIYDLVYASPKGGKVTGFLVTPAAGRGPFGGIVFGHWGPGNRTEFLPEAILYAQAGAVSVLIDYPSVRPAPNRVNQGKGFGEPEKDRASWEPAVVDLRRAIDLLDARPDVDKTRIGYVGHSYGAQWGAILTAIDRRIKATVLMGGVPSAEATTLEIDEPDVVAMVKEYTPAQVETYFEINRPYDAIRYVPYPAPTPLFFQFARHERFVTDAALKRYFEAASAPKLQRWYETGHELNDLRALADRGAWLSRRLGLSPMAPILAQRLETEVQ